MIRILQSGPAGIRYTRVKVLHRFEGWCWLSPGGLLAFPVLLERHCTHQSHRHPLPFGLGTLVSYDHSRWPSATEWGICDDAPTTGCLVNRVPSTLFWLTSAAVHFRIRIPMLGSSWRWRQACVGSESIEVDPQKVLYTRSKALLK